MKTFYLGVGHTIIVEEGNRGYEDDYKITFYEDGRKLTSEYGNKEYIKDYYGVELNVD
jgi:hypothetical protein